MKEKQLGLAAWPRMSAKQLTWVLLVLCFSSWFLYPVMIKFLAPSFFKVGVGSMGLLLVTSVLLFAPYRLPDISRSQLILLSCWVGYLVCLAIASVLSGSTYSMVHGVYFVSKLRFFIFLLFFISEDFIKKSFALYANLTIVVTILSLLVAAAFFIFHLQPFSYVPIDHVGGKVGFYGVSYYHTLSSHVMFEKQVYRLQGFCEEPGTFALSILPALYWVSIVEKSKLKSAILFLGLFGSFSVGAFLVLFLLFPIALFNYRDTKQLLLMSIVLPLLILLAYLYIEHTRFHEIALRTGMKVNFLDFRKYSVGDRWVHTVASFKALQHRWFGVGSSLGMTTVNLPIANGYAKVFLESGYIGGILYLLTFCMFAWQALKLAGVKMISTEHKLIRLAVAFSVITLVIFGAQRQQADISFWQMWVYASLFYLMKDRSAKLE